MGDVVASGWFILGPQVEQFESELSAHLGRRHAVGLASGTDALELAIRSVGSPTRDVVITAANAGGYASVAAAAAGMTVRWCEVDAKTHCLDPTALAELLDDRVAAVVVTHLYGRLADMLSIVDLTRAAGGSVIEDCAQAFGANRDGVPAGGFGDVAAFSFYPTKNLGALGDAGAVVTDDQRIAARIRRLRQYGWSSRYRITEERGGNSRLDELQAAVLRMRLPLVGAGNERRRSIISAYASAAPSAVSVLAVSGPEHAAHLAVVVSDRRDELAAHLAEHGVGSDVHYPVPDHQQPALKHVGVAPRRLHVTEQLSAQVLSLPCFPELSDPEVQQVCDVLARF